MSPFMHFYDQLKAIVASKDVGNDGAGAKLFQEEHRELNLGIKFETNNLAKCNMKKLVS